MGRWITWAAASLVVTAVGLNGAPLTVERTFVAQSDFEPFFRDAAIDLASAPGAITLRREWRLPGPRGNRLVGGVNGAFKVASHQLARLRFSLPDDRNGGAEIFLFYGTGGELRLNGTPLVLGEFPHCGGWRRAEADASLLKAGDNDLTFGPGLRIAQDRDAPPENSFVSTDDGKTWKPAEGGEFLVFVRVRRYPPRGVITSTVLDMAAGTNTAAIAPLFRIRGLDIQWRSIVPAGATVRIEARTGPTPWPDDPGWTPWTTAERVFPARYVQVRATLAPGAGDRAPSLARLTVTAQGETAATAEERGLRVREFRNPPLVRSAHPYGYQRPSDKLRRLRETYRLDEVVAAGETDLDKAILLRNWVRTRWTCNDAGSGKRTWDALEILGAPDGQRGMCVHFATVYYQCALALGFNARPVILTHHFVADIWCREQGKWVLMDVESVQPEGFRKNGTAFYRNAVTREPLGVLELHQAVLRAEKAKQPLAADVHQVYAMDTEEGAFTVTNAVRGPDSGLGIFRAFALPPRNDYLDRLEPWEEMHGQNYYHSDDYLWWRAAAPFERELHYGWKTDRPGDVNWTVHTPHLHLTVGDAPGQIRVVADTVTPNLQAYRFTVAGRPAVLLPGEGDDPDSRRSTFLWRLEPGLNTLSVTTLNRFDREGRAAEVTVEWTPDQETP